MTKATTGQVIHQDSCGQGAPIGAATAAKNQQTRWWHNTYLHIVLLAVLVTACFGRTLSSYFLADDFGELRYVHRVFQGHPELFFANLTGPYIGNPSILVWRPMMHISQVIDYALWGVNAFGYYLSNLLYYGGTVALLYLAVRQLTAAWSPTRSSVTAIFAAALFATSPLHCESVSWMVGRVDIISAFFYMATFNLYLAAIHRQTSFRGKLLLATGTVSFWLGMWGKEMAVFLPAVVFSAYFCFAEELKAVPAHSTFVHKLKSAFAFSAPLWVSLGAYFALRYLALGTFLGGYTGDLGAAQNANLLARWLDMDIMGRYFMPLTASLFPSSIFHQILSICYAMLGAVVLLKLAAGVMPWRWLAFLGVWAFTTCLPIYKLWGIGMNLEGGRFYFFLTLVTSVMIPVLVLSPWKQSRLLRRLDLRLSLLSAATLLVLTGTCGKAAYSTNLLWVHAGKEVKSFWLQCRQIAQSLAPGEKVALLGIPKNHGGAHMILNSQTFELMMSPPFTDSELYDNFYIFDPLFFGNPEFIDSDNFKRVADDPSTKAILLWQSDTSKFKEIQLSKANAGSVPVQPIEHPTLPSWHAYTRGHHKLAKPESESDIHLAGLVKDDGIKVPGLDLNPLDYDFLEFEFRCQPDNQPLTIRSVWNNDSQSTASVTIPATAGSSRFRRAAIRLSHSWRWYTAQRIREVELLLPALEKIEIRHLRLVNDAQLSPTIELRDLPTNYAGIYKLNDKAVTLEYDGSDVAGAAKIEVEVTKPNSCFDNLPAAQQQNIVSHRLVLDLPSGKKQLDKSLFSAAGFYQLRARCLDISGHPLKEFSEPMTIRAEGL